MCIEQATVNRLMINGENGRLNRADLPYDWLFGGTIRTYFTGMTSAVCPAPVLFCNATTASMPPTPLSAFLIAPLASPPAPTPPSSSPPPPPPPCCCAAAASAALLSLLGCFCRPLLPRLASASASAASSSYPAPLSAGSALAGSAATAPHHHHLLHRFHRSRSPHQEVAAVPPVTVQAATYSSTPPAAASPLSSYQLAVWEGASGSEAGAEGPPRVAGPFRR